MPLQCPKSGQMRPISIWYIIFHPDLLISGHLEPPGPFRSYLIPLVPPKAHLATLDLLKAPKSSNLPNIYTIYNVPPRFINLWPLRATMADQIQFDPFGTPKAHLGPLREDINRKKTFSFGHCPNHLNPPPMTPIRATWSFSFGRQKRRFSAYYRTK